MSGHPPAQGPAAVPIPVEVVGSPTPRRPPRRIGLGMVVLLLFFLAALGGSVLLNIALLIGTAFESDEGVREKFYSHARLGSQKVAIITVEGVLLGEEGFIKHQIDRAAKDEDVKAVVLRVDSPGGTTSAADYIYHHLCKLTKESNKPLVVSMGGLAASGGYYIAMAVGAKSGTIFAEPTTWTGSIGVMIPHYNVAGLMKEWGIEEDAVLSHPLKNMGTFSRTMSAEERKIFQALVDEQFERFKEVVKAGRPRFQRDPAALDKLATGQVYTATQAQKAGLIDEIGFLEDAVDRAIGLAGLDKDDVRVVKYEAQPTLSDLLFGGLISSRRVAGVRGVDWAALFDVTVPRAYYLCSWLPSQFRPGLPRP